MVDDFVRKDKEVRSLRARVPSLLSPSRTSAAPPREGGDPDEGVRVRGALHVR